MKRLLRWLLQLCFGLRTFNEQVLNTKGPVMLLPNHTSWLDWILLGVFLEDDWKFVTSRQASEVSFVHKFIMVNRYTFPVDMDSPYAVKHMAEFLQAGGRLVLFPEGRLSRTGSLMKLFDGTGFLIFKTKAKVITAYLRGAQRLPYSPNPNRKKLFQRVSLHFSDVLVPPTCEGISTTHTREKLTHWLQDVMVKQQFEAEMAMSPKTILASILQTARENPSFVVLQDASHAKLTYRRLTAATQVMAQELGKHLSAEPRHIGVLLPNTNAMPISILALWALGKTPAILNYSTGANTMLACAEIAGLKQIITSHTFLEKAHLNIELLLAHGIEFVYLEDIRAKITGLEGFIGLLNTYVPWLSPLHNEQHNESAVILFTSGSEGPPKAVDLSHRNILSNIRQMLSVIDLVETDRIFNGLPLFHSFGLTIGLLLPLVRGSFTFLYPSPLHYRVIPTLFYDLDCTVFFGTNTFLNGYARKAHSYDFRSLRYLFAGAEKLQEATANVWSRKFGAQILEGYGATECSPCVSANTLHSSRFGSAGRLLPAIEYRLEHVEGVAEGGRLWVRGPNVMRGYLNPEANAKFQALGGWYDTGDIAKFDDDGYLFILGRLKRFAKVSGEMVSLTAAEEALSNAFPQFGLRFQVAVLSRPDADRGEALVAVTNEPKLTMEEVRAAIKAKGLSNLYVPREIKYVHEIPKLGTGKINHRELQKLIEVQ
jgi:acyl-[acyl-carrier-protein]-phospholipid O-acyltransferase/long-chain-fatty-acid--[acyl-carrier-protein] ligase